MEGGGVVQFKIDDDDGAEPPLMHRRGAAFLIAAINVTGERLAFRGDATPATLQRQSPNGRIKAVIPTSRTNFVNDTGCWYKLVGPVGSSRPVVISFNSRQEVTVTDDKCRTW